MKIYQNILGIRLKYLGLLCKKCLLGEMLCEIKNYPFLCTCCTIFPGTLKLIIEQISFEKIVLKNRLSGKFIFLSLPLVKKKQKTVHWWRRSHFILFWLFVCVNSTLKLFVFFLLHRILIFMDGKFKRTQLNWLWALLTSC